MIALPFAQRVLLLAAVFAAIALISRDGSRWKEYLFLFVAAGAGGVYGVFNDLMTSAISPAYFEIGKDLARGQGFGGRVAELGFHAGFVAAAFAACALLYTNNPREGRPRLGYGELSRAFVLAGAIAVGAGCVAGIASLLVEPTWFLRTVDVVVPTSAARGFLTVAAIHAGLYLGFVIGVARSVWWIRGKRGDDRRGAGGFAPQRCARGCTPG